MWSDKVVVREKSMIVGVEVDRGMETNNKKKVGKKVIVRKNCVSVDPMRKCFVTVINHV